MLLSSSLPLAVIVARAHGNGKHDLSLELEVERSLRSLIDGGIRRWLGEIRACQSVCHQSGKSGPAVNYPTGWSRIENDRCPVLKMKVT